MRELVCTLISFFHTFNNWSHTAITIYKVKFINYWIIDLKFYELCSQGDRGWIEVCTLTSWMCSTVHILWSRSILVGNDWKLCFIEQRHQPFLNSYCRSLLYPFLHFVRMYVRVAVTRLSYPRTMEDSPPPLYPLPQRSAAPSAGQVGKP